MKIYLDIVLKKVNENKKVLSKISKDIVLKKVNEKG
jgi:hypothetical protein